LRRACRGAKLRVGDTARFATPVQPNHDHQGEASAIRHSSRRRHGLIIGEKRRYWSIRAWQIWIMERPERPRAFVTGVTGFGGRALASHLAARGWTVVGSHGGARPVPTTLRRCEVRIVIHDLTDPEQTFALFQKAQPDAIFHLAGQTGVNAESLLHSHIAATNNLLSAARRLESDAVIVIPGSSAQFGNVPEHQQPITEETEYNPVTLYGIAKVAEAWTAKHFHREYGLKIIRTHTFNAIGPGQRPQFVPATFACQIAAIERGAAPPFLQVGNLVARRDMIDIRDIAEAYLRLAIRGRPGDVYNICTGRARSIASVIDELERLARVTFEIRPEPSRVQTADVTVQIGDPLRLRHATGWQPSVPFEQSMADVLEEWRAA
jgi:GDP-4-dehydro-6-deoxy-D-mannose reductase